MSKCPALLSLVPEAKLEVWDAKARLAVAVMAMVGEIYPFSNPTNGETTKWEAEIHVAGLPIVYRLSWCSAKPDTKYPRKGYH